MRRLAIIAAATAPALAAASLLGAGAQAGSTYRVDAVFDTAKGIIPGQLVKIAGARVGEVKDVTLTADYKARIQMEVDARFVPFRADASCSIQPEGLISENFVQCDPGTADAPALAAPGGGTPTVPVERTSVPVNLTDLFQVWQAPVRDRFSILVGALGSGLAGRGDDVNDLLRRANPSLAMARRAVTLLSEQRSELRTLITSTRKVSDELARKRRSFARLAVTADRVTAVTARHGDDLAAAVRDLPPLLDAAEPALSRLDELTTDGRPVLADLRAAAPALTRLMREVEPFSDSALPVVRRLDPAISKARKAVRDVAPLARLLDKFAKEALPAGASLALLTTNLRDTGFPEFAGTFVYRTAAAAARFDARSHILPAQFLITECSLFSETPDEGCSANWSQPAAQAEPARRPRSKAPEQRKAAAPKAPAPAEAKAPAQPAEPVQDLVRKLGGGLRGEDGSGPLRLGPGSPLGSLLDYLLGR